MDPVTALAAASTAFGLIKKGFAAGRDIESMYGDIGNCLLYTSPSPRDVEESRMPSSA